MILTLRNKKIRPNSGIMRENVWLKIHYLGPETSLLEPTISSYVRNFFYFAPKRSGSRSVRQKKAGLGCGADSLHRFEEIVGPI